MQNNYEEELNRNNILAFVPGGDSMWPTLKNAKQSVIVTKKTSKPDVNDVVLYKRLNGQYVLHRIVSIQNKTYTMCGDSQFNLEPGIAENQILGILDGYYKGKKYIKASDKKSYKTALFLRKHTFIKKVAVKLHFIFKRLRGK